MLLQLNNKRQGQPFLLFIKDFTHVRNSQYCSGHTDTHTHRQWSASVWACSLQTSYDTTVGSPLCDEHARAYTQKNTRVLTENTSINTPLLKTNKTKPYSWRYTRYHKHKVKFLHREKRKHPFLTPSPTFFSPPSLLLQPFPNSVTTSLVADCEIKQPLVGNRGTAEYRRLLQHAVTPCV